MAAACCLLLAAPALAQTPPDPDLPSPLREVGFEQKLGERKQARKARRKNRRR